MRRMPSHLRSFGVVAACSLAGACGWTEVERESSSAAPLAYDEVDDFLQLPDGLTLGQVSGLAVDSTDRLIVFHRAGADFDNEVPIEEATILVFDAQTGELLDRFGEGLFVVPHGISVDAQDHIWATDARSDLVIELSSTGEVLATIDGAAR